VCAASVRDVSACLALLLPLLLLLPPQGGA
jgi:hypothetical protein